MINQFAIRIGSRIGMKLHKRIWGDKKPPVVFAVLAGLLIFWGAIQLNHKLDSVFMVIGQGSMIETVAEVIDVRPYAKSRRPRIWLRYKFETKKGKPARGAARRYVKSIDAVSVGDLITIKYNSRRPSRTRVIALSVTAVGHSSEKKIPAASEKLQTWLVPAMTFGAVLVAGGLFYLLITSLLLPWLSQSGTASEARAKPGARPVTRPDFERYRLEPVQSIGRTKPLHGSSKVKQRAGWFG